MRRFAFLLAFLIPLAAAGCDRAPQPRDRSEAEVQVRRAVADYSRAVVTADARALNGILSNDYSYVTSQGEVRDKTSQISHLTGDIEIMSAGAEDLQIAWIGEDALVIGRFPARLRSGEQRSIVNERFSQLWVPENGHWRLRHEHVSLIPTPGG